MPELSTFMTPDDFFEIVSECLAAGCGIVPDRNELVPEYREFRTIEQVRAVAETRLVAGWFIVSPRWERCPLEMSSFEKDGIRQYFVSQRNGGPTIDLCAWSLVGNPARNFVAGGFVSHYPHFWNWKTNQNEKPAKELVACYRTLCSHIKKNSVRVQPGKHSYFVTRRTVESGLGLGPPLENVDLAKLR
jgi:hypothetical protein